MKLLASDAAKLGLDLSSHQLEQFRRYYRSLVAWNERVNLTAVTGCEEVQTRHFLDSLTASTVIPSPLLQSSSILDLGSGAGFPGIPLRIVFPGIALTLLESRAKRTAFLEHLVELLDLGGTRILNGRAETLAHRTDLRENFDVVLARSVARLPVLAELALGFCRVGGRVALHKGAQVDGEVQEAHYAVETMGGTLKEVRKSVLGPDDSGALVVLDKVETTPDRYPRRPGIPAKRPLVGPMPLAT